MTELQEQPKPSNFFSEILDKLSPDGRGYEISFRSESGIKTTFIRLFERPQSIIEYRYELYIGNVCECKVCQDEDYEGPKMCVDQSNLRLYMDSLTKLYETFDSLIELIENSQQCIHCSVVNHKDLMIQKLCTNCYSKQQFKAYLHAKAIPTTKSVNKN